jgi:hypothetical protein
MSDYYYSSTTLVTEGSCGISPATQPDAIVGVVSTPHEKEINRPDGNLFLPTSLAPSEDLVRLLDLVALLLEQQQH